MKEFKGTPGPWVWHADNRSSWLGPVDSNRWEGVVIDDGSAFGEYEKVICPNGHNANLIAAAPDLLEALKDIVNSSQPFHSALEIENYAGVALYDNAVKAIAKALGESQ